MYEESEKCSEEEKALLLVRERGKGWEMRDAWGGFGRRVVVQSSRRQRDTVERGREALRSQGPRERDRSREGGKEAASGRSSRGRTSWLGAKYS